MINIKYKNENKTEECQKILDDINSDNKKELKLIKSFNLTIKITVFVLFGFNVINVGVVFYFIHVGLCYDEDYGGRCQNWEHTFSLKFIEEDEITWKCIWILFIFAIICL